MRSRIPWVRTARSLREAAIFWEGPDSLSGAVADLINGQMLLITAPFVEIAVDTIAVQRDILQPIILTGKHVQLVPLATEHSDGLIAAVQDGELWRLWYTSAPAPDAMKADIERRLGLQRAGSMLPFTVIDLHSGGIVGMTTYMNVDSVNRRVEIGSTWYARRVQRSALNTEAKYLLLGHAFETLECIAVEFRTHFMNHQSRRAIERLGAKLDGILRSHSFASNGTLRDTCVYSVIAPEWPAVKSHLRWQMERPR